VPDLQSHVIRLVIVDDHAMFREGITVLLGKEPDLQVIGQFGDPPRHRICFQITCETSKGGLTRAPACLVREAHFADPSQDAITPSASNLRVLLPVVRGLFAVSHLLAAQIGVITANPVFPRRGKHIHDDTILQHIHFMRGMGRNLKVFAGADDLFATVDGRRHAGA